MSKNPLIDTLTALSGQDEVLVIHRSFVRFTGSVEAALMLNQLLYWTPKSQLTIDNKTGWIARSDQEWADELMLTQYTVRQTRSTLEKLGLIETTLRKFGGIPKIHYRVILETLRDRWIDFLKTQSGLCENAKSNPVDFANSQSPLCENAETCIENTIETTLIESKIEDRAANAAPPSPSQPVLLAPDPDQTTAFNGPLDTLFQEALKAEAKADGRRGPQKWGSFEQKQVYRTAAQKIVDRQGQAELERAIAEGLSRERKSRDSLVAWIKAWAENLDKPRQTERDDEKVGPALTQAQREKWYGRKSESSAYTGGPSLTREQARQWYGH